MKGGPSKEVVSNEGEFSTWGTHINYIYVPHTKFPIIRDHMFVRAVSQKGYYSVFEIYNKWWLGKCPCNNIFGSDDFSFDQTSFRKCTHVQSTMKYDNYNSWGEYWNAL